MALLWSMETRLYPNHSQCCWSSPPVNLYVHIPCRLQTEVITSRTVLVDRLGLAGAGITMLMYASPMMELVTVIRTKSTRSISRPLTVATFFASSLWFYYGYLLQDPYVQVSIWKPGRGLMCLALNK
ncbi:SLC50A1 [Branchiostoma lanceolatum]|uniref:Sugar transporter SWEET1 n=1 Tax=Branchiostoma lanceolatum TaxID=7740 RepID=A0A8S4MNM0_BRALA|nr:SLC50A1 [Branchiostoma lanceolatum]